ncbi:trigger factor [Oceanicella sp. SM1341]|uniref:trigger factor n=1 Tax=Oceanicella sp. SM1341 TaxID=1548889 RepID=UPI000E4E1D39|nr:trigger factor [Oceanicella sp. SM1341]
MQVTETLNEGLKRGYSMTLTADALEAKVNEKLDAVRADFQMKGFRKGKAPAALMKKMFGKSVIGEAMQEVVDEAMKSHFEASGDRPAQQPDVKVTNQEWKEGEDLTVEMSYEKLPEIEQPDFSTLKLERLVVEVEDGAINEALENLANSAQNFAAREEGAAAEDGDQVVIDFAGSIDGELFEGGSAEDYPLVLGSNSFIPGFEEQLVGAKAGDEVEVKVSFPEEYGAPNLAGKEASFACKVKEVKAPEAAAIDDELAKKFGAESLDDLKAQITERLGAEYKGAARSVLKRQLMDSLDDLVSFELPTALVDAEAQQVAHQLWHEEHPEVQGHDHGAVEVTDEHKKLAERRVRLGLLLADTGAKAGVQVSENELNQAVMRQAMQYRGQEKQFFDFVKNNPQALQSIQAPIYEDKVVDYIVELAEVSDKTVTKEELQKTIESLDEE